MPIFPCSHAALEWRSESTVSKVLEEKVTVSKSSHLSDISDRYISVSLSRGRSCAVSIFKTGRKYCEQIVANSCQVFIVLLAMVVVGHAGPAQGTVDPHIDVQFWPVSWSLPAIHPDHVSSPI